MIKNKGKQKPSQPITLEQIKTINDQSIQKALKEQTEIMFKHFVTKDEFNKEIDNLKQQIKNLPTKDEFFDNTDKVMGELRAIREESEILNNRTSDHTDQLENHEQRITKLEQPQILTA